MFVEAYNDFTLAISGGGPQSVFLTGNSYTGDDFVQKLTTDLGVAVEYVDAEVTDPTRPTNKLVSARINFPAGASLTGVPNSVFDVESVSTNVTLAAGEGLDFKFVDVEDETRVIIHSRTSTISSGDYFVHDIVKQLETDLSMDIGYDGTNIVFKNPYFYPYTQLGGDIIGENAGDEFGYSVSLSADGTIVAIGARRSDANGFNSGHVSVYELVGSSWIQLGEDINGEAANDWSHSVSLSSNGTTTIVAIGAYRNDGNGNDSGHVRVYQYDVTKTVAVTDQSSSTFGPVGWNRLGDDIDGESGGDFSGQSVSLSADGTILAIGADRSDANGYNSGHVRIYQYNGSSSWVQLGGDIDGEAG